MYVYLQGIRSQNNKGHFFDYYNSLYRFYVSFLQNLLALE